jgi:hypothetical protein
MVREIFEAGIRDLDLRFGAPGQRFTTLISTALKHQLYLSKTRKQQSHVTITLVV